MKTNSIVVAVLLGVGVSVDAGAILVRGLYNTGVDDSGQVIPLHAVEQHWMVQGPVDVVYRAPIVYHSPGNQAWVTPPEGSAWIGPNPTESTWPLDPPGHYIYRLEFFVTSSGTDRSGLVLSGEWASDDWSEIWLNGAYTGWSRRGVASEYLVGFSIQDGFVDGLNVLEFRVENFDWPWYPLGNPTGLLVANLQANYRIEPGPAPVPPVSVPERGSPLAMMFGGILAAALARRWKEPDALLSRNAHRLG